MYKRIKLFIQDKIDTLSSTRDIMRVYDEIIEGLLKGTSLTKKEATKIAYDAMDSIELIYDSSINPELYESPIESPSALMFHMVMIRSIRSNEDCSEEVHQYCDYDVKALSEVISNVENEDSFTIADKKVLDGMIARFMNSFDKFREYKKYNGIWY
jgi:hypothetical protein